MFLRILYKPKRNTIRNTSKNIRDFEVFKNILNGDKIININPVKLLKKNRG